MTPGAVFDAYKEGITVHPEVMFPLVCCDHEIETIAPVVKVGARDTDNSLCAITVTCLHCHMSDSHAYHDTFHFLFSPPPVPLFLSSLSLSSSLPLILSSSPLFSIPLF